MKLSLNTETLACSANSCCPDKYHVPAELAQRKIKPDQAGPRKPPRLSP